MTSRRDFLKLGAAGAALTQAMFNAALARAVAAPAHRRTGSLKDVEHIVILMQENRSFDHYFGTMAGLRGFADPHPAPLPSGDPVWRQPTPDGGVATPFLFDAVNTSFPIMKSLPHDRDAGLIAWNRGHCDRWVEAKGPLTMGHLDRASLPFHFALADAFTICDSYFSSLHGPTCPNRLFMMTGSNDPNGASGGAPVVDNDNATQIPNGKRVYGPGWVTFPERLQRAGINWRTYRQGVDPHSDSDSDGGMNLLPAFETFLKAKPGNPLYERGIRPRRLAQLKRDVEQDQLAQVSWIFPPRNFCEHPKYPPIYGMEFIARVLDALTSNPEVWSRTTFILTYDENDGFFDHVVPPTAPGSPEEGASTVSTDGELDAEGRPYGLGPRVPTIVISPWSRGGYVCSETFDHTSLIRFIEARFGVHEPNISPWRRAVCGDLTSAFDFTGMPKVFPPELGLTDASAELPDQARFQIYREGFLAKPKPVAPAMAAATLPAVEAGTRPARPLGYRFSVEASSDPDGVCLHLVNEGALGAAFQVYDLDQPAALPKRFTVSAAASLTHRFSSAAGRYNLQVHGPAGFFRAFSNRTKGLLNNT